jgi:hypothetical protein
MKKIKRNEPCDCGSGKKYKVCHGKLDKGFNQQWMIIAIIGAIFFLFFFILSDSSTSTTTNLAPSPSRAVGNAGNQQPAGEAPPGKVWSPEHGHWHDINTNVSPTTSPTNNSLQQQPAGEAPPGKVWSPEHGHWHDIQ